MSKHSTMASEEHQRWETTDALVRTGLRDVGYRYVNLDDCWQKTRSPSGEILPDENAFPSGMKALADYVHGKDMLFGLVLISPHNTKNFCYCTSLPSCHATRTGFERVESGN
ncbi:4369_t:CDS:2 [Paraglomus occultum]|uniref:Alpha-galactosidase n=1 Tax=Paraglomus occultum TaxID=144539 RepID=A0A9N8ZPL3_9GLOM|nr:4369_t:CDS:2 [Paraglomus occultum]